MLNGAQQQIAQGRPRDALETVLQLLSALKMPDEVFAAAHRVRDAMGQQSPNSDGMLSGLLLRMTLEAEQNHSAPPATPDDHCMSDAEGYGGGMDAAERQRGRDEQRMAMLTIAEEQESYVCERCGNVISVRRRHAHSSTWCESLGGPPG